MNSSVQVIKMDTLDFDDGIVCPNCGSKQTEQSRLVRDEWFCFLCGIFWNPKGDYMNNETKKATLALLEAIMYGIVMGIILAVMLIIICGIVYL